MAHLSLTLQQCLVATIPAFTVVVESGYKRTLAHPAIYATILALYDKRAVDKSLFYCGNRGSGKIPVF